MVPPFRKYWRRIVKTIQFVWPLVAAMLGPPLVERPLTPKTYFLALLFFLSIAAIYYLVVNKTARRFASTVWFCITHLERIRSLVEHNNAWRKIESEFIAGHEVSGLLLAVSNAFSLDEVKQSLHRLRDLAPKLGDTDGAVVADELRLDELVNKWGEEVVRHHSQVRAALALGNPWERPLTWRAIASSLEQQLDCGKQPTTRSLPTARKECCLELGTHLSARLVRFEEHAETSRIRDALVDLFISLIHSWKLGGLRPDDEWGRPLVEAIPTMRLSKDQLNTALRWAVSLLQQSPALLGKSFANCLIELKDDILDVDSSVLQTLHDPDIATVCHPHFEPLYKTVLAVPHSPSHGRVWKRKKFKNLAITRVNGVQQWRADEMSLCGTWALGCREDFGTPLGTVQLEIENGPATRGVVEIESCFVAQSHFSNPPDGRGLVFVSCTPGNRRKLFELFAQSLRSD